MYKLLLIAPLFFIGCGQTITKTEEMASVSFDSNYQPATFADAGRMDEDGGLVSAACQLASLPPFFGTHRRTPTCRHRESGIWGHWRDWAA